MVVVHKEFSMEPLVEIDEGVVDGFNLEIIVERFFRYVPGSNDTQKN
jgi:hypothetical protein